MGSYILWCLIALCLGYFLGRYWGWQEGYAEGLAYAPIHLHAQALLQGICPLCQTTFPSSDDINCEEFDT